ncbi:hypothetical protein CKO36_19050 [Rhabdochromatium marinum]|nr:hypothetical protein [Rhabdochromatium marinum]
MNTVARPTQADALIRALGAADVFAREGRADQAPLAAVQAYAHSPDPACLAAALIQGHGDSLGRVLAGATRAEHRRIGAVLRRSLAVPSARRRIPPAPDLAAIAPPLASRAGLEALLQTLHQQVQPRFYLQIGLDQEDALALAQGRAIGVDPIARPPRALGAQVQRFTATADEFFAFLAADSLRQAPDLVLLAGLPLAEARLSELLQLEAHADARTLVVIPGIFPTAPERATRRRTGRDWQGDLWKLPAVLPRLRPALRLLALDVPPTGVLLVSGLAPSRRPDDPPLSAVLEPLRTLAPPPAPILQRQGACAPGARPFQDYLQRLSAPAPR